MILTLYGDPSRAAEANAWLMEYQNSNVIAASIHCLNLNVLVCKFFCKDQNHVFARTVIAWSLRAGGLGALGWAYGITACTSSIFCGQYDTPEASCWRRGLARGSPGVIDATSRSVLALITYSTQNSTKLRPHWLARTHSPSIFNPRGSRRHRSWGRSWS